MIGPSAGMVINGLAGGIADILVDMVTEVCMTAVFVVVITLEGVAPVSNTNVRAGTVFDTEASIVVRVDVMGDDLIDSLPRTVTDVVPDIVVSAGVDANIWVSVMYFLVEFVTLPPLSEEMLLC